MDNVTMGKKSLNTVDSKWKHFKLLFPLVLKETNAEIKHYRASFSRVLALDPMPGPSQHHSLLLYEPKRSRLQAPSSLGPLTTCKQSLLSWRHIHLILQTRMEGAVFSMYVSHKKMKE